MKPTPGTSADPSLLRRGKETETPHPSSPFLNREGSALVPGVGYAIEVRDLVKEFRVYHRSYGSLKSHAAALAKTLVRRDAPSGFETRRALNGVSFGIRPGEAVALIGRNGSGKSTLLSLLSRIYLPTAGEARLRGRMMSLLELGAGFDGGADGQRRTSSSTA